MYITLGTESQMLGGAGIRVEVLSSCFHRIVGGTPPMTLVTSSVSRAATTTYPILRTLLIVLLLSHG